MYERVLHMCEHVLCCMYVRVRDNYEVHTAVYICMACKLVRVCAMLYVSMCVCGLSVGRSVQHVSVLRA